MPVPNQFLIAAAVLDLLAAALHLGCIVLGAPWYRFFGAGEPMARLAQAGSARPAIVAASIAAVLITWSCYALAASGAVSLRPPLLRAGLCAITAGYLLRGLGGLGLAAWTDAPAPIGRSIEFWWWSSAICLGFGVIHLIGAWQVWRQLQPIPLG